jgi:hypothetical protein
MNFISTFIHDKKSNSVKKQLLFNGNKIFPDQPTAGTIRSTTEDDQTLHSCADTLDQTLHSCADTLVGEDDLHSLADTLNDHSDDEFFDQMLPPDSRNSRNFDD